VKPQHVIGSATTPDGRALVLHERDGVFTLRVDGLELMSSRARGSEVILAALGTEGIRTRAAPRVMVGGLGMGYTVRAALDLLPTTATVEVVEVFPAVVEWCRGPLSHLARDPLADHRVRIHVQDVHTYLETMDSRYDAILLDVDNGPSAFTLDRNQRLYQGSGLSLLRSRLRPGGMLAVWSADPDPSFLRRLGRAGFTARSQSVPDHGGGGRIRHTIFLATT